MSDKNVEARRYEHSFEQNEQVSTGRLLLRAVKMFWPEKYDCSMALYAYLRYFDDIVDSGKDVEMTMDILRQEIEYLESVLASGAPQITIDEHSPFYREILLKGIHTIDDPAKQREVLSQTLLGIKAFYLDAIAIKWKRPLPRAAQEQRNTLALLPNLEILSLILFNRKFSKESDKIFSRLMTVWINYDALRDFSEDLPAGIVVFPREVLRRHNVDLTPGEHVPDTFNDLHRTFKRETIKDLISNVGVINESTLPLLPRILFQVYFLICVLKLSATPSMGEKKIVFSQV